MLKSSVQLQSWELNDRNTVSHEQDSATNEAEHNTILIMCITIISNTEDFVSRKFKKIHR